MHKQIVSMMAMTVLVVAQHSDAALQLDYRADQGVQTTGGAPANFGDNVLNWLDQSDNNKATQPTVSLRPIYQQATIGISLKPVVRFDGGDDWLRSVAGAGTIGPT